MRILFTSLLAVTLLFLSAQSHANSAAQVAVRSASNIGKIDLVIVKKSEANMMLMRNGQIIRSYRVAMGDRPDGHKVQEGDQRTPEGRYILDYKKSNSAYHRAIHISYPNEEDKLRAETLGVKPGGQIMIHGQNPHSNLTPDQAQRLNWTDGCIALKNEEIDELWQAIETGTPIEIWP
ncbi:L,D-transpeptidase family protein [Shewanella sp. AS1]|uniref:L,D-transpeptidase family protein n=1 Tax=Shewanella sp. AS1 TaxID=2907626 RepID=UPI001F01E199|nr:L,D-transpeptidase family protein [Shewanella sp. AS1]MCE9679492.1 L,D-transpeptidase family protein [Shewanella sp. AS1]